MTFHSQILFFAFQNDPSEHRSTAIYTCDMWSEENILYGSSVSAAYAAPPLVEADDLVQIGLLLIFFKLMPCTSSTASVKSRHYNKIENICSTSFVSVFARTAIFILRKIVTLPTFRHSPLTPHFFYTSTRIPQRARFNFGCCPRQNLLLSVKSISFFGPSLEST